MIFTGMCLMTNDVRKLSDFYQKVLKTTSDCDDEIHQEIQIEGALFAILKNEKSKKSGNTDMTIVFTVDDIDREYERLREIGVVILDKPIVQPWGTKNMRFLDPDGNFVIFRTFLTEK